MTDKLIVVAGATGKQGQAVINSLIDKGYRIRALVRNQQKATKLLSLENVEIFQGDLKTKDSLNGLFEGAYGLFFTLPLSKKSVVFGKTLLDSATESETKHIVFSSVGGADRYEKVDHFRDKKVMEDYLRRLGKPYTILRPVGYMEAFADPRSIKFISGLLRLYLHENKRFQLISLQDIGAFAEIAFSNPMKYIGKEMEIAGDELTLDEVFSKIKQVTQREISPNKFPRFIASILPKGMQQMFRFYAEDGWNANLKSLREENPKLLSFEAWLHSTDLYHHNEGKARP